MGIEPSLKKNSNNQIKATLEDFKSDNTFDGIVLMDVFEHFGDPKLSIEKISSLLSNSGYLFMKVPNKDSLLYRVCKLFRISKILARMYQIDFPPQHFFYYNLKSLKAFLEKSNFSYMDHFYVSEVPLNSMWSRLWGLPFLIKPFIFLACLVYNVITLESFKDSLIVCFKKGV